MSMGQDFVFVGSGPRGVRGGSGHNSGKGRKVRRNGKDFATKKGVYKTSR